MRPRAVSVLALAAALAWPGPAQAYLKFVIDIRGFPITLKWDGFPVRYFVTDAPGGGLSAPDLQGAVSRAFATWSGVRTAAVGGQFVGYTSAPPLEEDGRSTLGFLSRPDLERVLGQTVFVIDETTGALVESDIFFNSDFPWSVAAAGEGNRFDLESTAVHEIGHLFGLGHSALGETELRPGGGRRVLAAGAVMFPIAFSAGSVALRTPQPDDIAGLSDLYAAAGTRDDSGSIQGRVTLNGRPVFGAHVVAFDPATGALVGGFTFDDGRFLINALRPGPKVLRVEPLDDADLESFFDEDAPVELDFRVTVFDRLVAVPRGGAAPSVTIAVPPK